MLCRNASFQSVFKSAFGSMMEREKNVNVLSKVFYPAIHTIDNKMSIWWGIFITDKFR